MKEDMIPVYNRDAHFICAINAEKTAIEIRKNKCVTRIRVTEAGTLEVQEDG